MEDALSQVRKGSLKDMSPAVRDMVIQEERFHKGQGRDFAERGLNAGIAYERSLLMGQIDMFGHIDTKGLLAQIKAETDPTRRKELIMQFLAATTAAAREAGAKTQVGESAAVAGATGLIAATTGNDKEAKELQAEFDKKIKSGNAVFLDNANVLRRRFLDTLTAEVITDSKTVSPSQYKDYLKSGGPGIIPSEILQGKSPEMQEKIRRSLTNIEDFDAAQGAVAQARDQALAKMTKLDILRQSEMAAESAGGGVQQVHIANFYDMIDPMRWALRMDKAPEASGPRKQN
jgi:hypothetical protein